MVWKKKDNPRYNVLSFRVSDDELCDILDRISGPRQKFIRQAVIEKINRDRQAIIDDTLHSIGVSRA